MDTEKDFTMQARLIGERENGQTFSIVDHRGNELERIQYLPTGEVAWRQISFWTLLPNNESKVTRWTMHGDGTLQSRLEGHKIGGRVLSQVYYDADGRIIDEQHYDRD